MTEIDRLRKSLQAAASCGTHHPGYSAADSTRAALALAKWEAAGDWETVPAAVEVVIGAMGRGVQRKAPAA